MGISRLTDPRRYQLTKEAVSVVRSGHPWIFRRRLSSAALVFANGQWLRLVDGANTVVGYGFYQERGAIGIRILRRGAEPPDGAWVESAVRTALDRRAALRSRTDGFRAIHGESDGLAAVTADVYGSVGVVSSYSRGADPVARQAARLLRRGVPLEGVLWKPAARRHDAGSSPPGDRVLFGRVPDRVEFREEGQRMTVSPGGGQKTGSFLDLRGLRSYLRSSLAGALQGARVLDLFSYTGSLGAAAESAGGSEIWHVDSSRAALELGREHHVVDPARHRFLEADAFEWVPALDPGERFDLVLSDPPQMTSRVAQVPAALRAYSRLYRGLADHVRPGGVLVACCCTSRIDVETFRKTVRHALGREFRFVQRIPPEPDHPVGFPEADYLKILVFRKRIREAPADPLESVESS